MQTSTAAGPPARARHASPRGPRAAHAALAAALASALPGAAAAAGGERGAPSLPEVVVGTTPLPGTAVTVEELPGEVHSLEMAAAPGGPAASAVEALAGRYAGVGIEDPSGDAFQPGLVFRGFSASTVLGSPQGLAVYLNGVRQNEAFGDVVNWDLVPEFAVRRIDVTGANPALGANALGGAVLLTMKNGLADRGLAAAIEGGSFGARAATVEYGAFQGPLALYVGAHALDEDGARRFAANALRQLYADLRYATDRASIDLSVSGAHNRLDGPGAAPVQELALSRTLTFTEPQRVENRLGLAALNLESRLDETASLAGLAYYRHFRQELANGNTTAYRPCTLAVAAALLCEADGTTLITSADGTPLPDPTGGGATPLGENDFESVRTTTWGGSVQLAKRAVIAGRRHALAVGVALDASRVDFAAGAAVGPIDALLEVAPGPVVATPEGTPFPATPIELAVRTRRLAWHASDALAVTPALTATAGLVYATDTIELVDGRGTELSGSSRYERLNPALGATYRLAGGATAYLGYAETSRAPSPSEIECSDPARPCLLPSTLAGDPPRLRQVVARTFEAGMRQADGALGIAGLGASLGLFHTAVANDIYGIATSAGAGYYSNIGATHREGLSAELSYRTARWSGSLSYALVAATFRSSLAIPSPNNPFADASGTIAVRPGADLPGIPRERVVLDVEVRATPRLRLGATLTGVGPSYLHGDESNQNPRLPGYARLDLRLAADLGAGLELSVAAVNVLDARYATYGLYADPTGVGAPGVPAADAAADRRFESPAAPFALMVGLRLRR